MKLFIIARGYLMVCRAISETNPMLSLPPYCGNQVRRKQVGQGQGKGREIGGDKHYWQRA